MKNFPILPSWRQYWDKKGNYRDSIPWHMVEPHEFRAMVNHGGQTLEELAQRGGLCPYELMCVLKDEKLKFKMGVPIDREAAHEFIEDYIRSWE